MTDEPVVVAEEQEPSGPKMLTVHCRHCGAEHEMQEGSDPDWQCDQCDQYQDTVACPVCHQATRASLLDPAQVPAPHAPQRKKKGDQ